MYYGYNSFTNRLIGAHRLTAYAPQGLQSMGSAEPTNPYPPNYVKPGPSKAGVKVEAVRAASGAAHGHGSTEFGKLSERVLKIRTKLQKAEHLPVHLKGGPLDYVLFYVTAGLALAGVGLTLKTIYTLAYPKKPQ